MRIVNKFFRYVHLIIIAKVIGASVNEEKEKWWKRSANVPSIKTIMNGILTG